jgi:thiopurine S-methyltransferase
MDREFWLERWRKREIGFHEGRPNAMLEKHWPTLGLAPRARVLVPLCGKSLDLVWLAARGHRVAGVELSEIAVREFFTENEIEPAVEARGALTVWSGGDVEVWCGDLFALDSRQLGPIDGVYDRAALVAMPPDRQPAYGAQVASIVGPRASGLLITVAYDQDRMQGPPFSTPLERVHMAYGPHFEITEVDRGDALDNRSELRQRGIDSMESITMRLSRR